MKRSYSEILGRYIDHSKRNMLAGVNDMWPTIVDLIAAVIKSRNPTRASLTDTKVCLSRDFRVRRIPLTNGATPAMSPILLFALVFIISGVPGAAAHSYKLGTLEIGHLWAPLPVPGADGVPVYGPFLNGGEKSIDLIGASSLIAGEVRLRVKNDGAESWQATMTLPPGKPVALAPWGAHIWLSGLKRKLKIGDWFDLTLDFGPAGKLNVKIPVQKSAGD